MRSEDIPAGKPFAGIPDGHERNVSITARESTLAAVELLDLEAEALAEDWRELCRWDPQLPPDTEPPVTGPVIVALADAMRRPQPLGWGADERMEAAMADFTERAGPAAVAQLICLREAVSRRFRGRVPPYEAEETWSRLQMTIDRAMLLAARWAYEQLERDVRIDALTGVGNRRAFDIEMRRELGRVARHGGSFSLVILDVDGLKAVNDTLGHNVGDAHLQALATALSENTRLEDSTYRLGGDEFALLMPEGALEEPKVVIRRVAEAAMPARFSWGLSCAPEDGDTVEALMETADARLYQQRSEARGRGGT